MCLRDRDKERERGRERPLGDKKTEDKAKRAQLTKKAGWMVMRIHVHVCLCVYVCIYKHGRAYFSYAHWKDF